jgi:signal transduction histidine kinase
VRDAEGAVDGAGIVVREVTDERRAAREVEHARRRLEVLHRLEASIVRADDPSHVVQSALAAVRDLLGAAHAAIYRVDLDARTRTLLALDAPNVPPGVLGRAAPLPEVVADAIVGDRPLALSDIRDLAGDDPSFAGAVKVGTLAMLVVPLPGPEGLILMADWAEVRPADENEPAIVREIGDTLAIAFRQNELFNTVAAHAEELEARVEERTRQLSEINAELDAFSYTVSHDLRAPLRAMQGFATAIVEDEGDRLSPMGHEFAARIVTAGQRMEGLIGDLLEYSRVSRVQFRPETVDLDVAVATAVHQLEATLAASGAEVIVDPPLGTVTGHLASVTQAVANLLANGAKFVAPGSPPRILVSAERRDGERRDGDRLRLTVADNGIGIAPDHLDRIFRVFERLHGQESYAGTGIGLAIVRKGVERMGGSVGVESTPGEGSRFWIELPAMAPDVEQSAATREHSA